ncbi:hypothetical protein OEZ86_000682 [Tetradesmus obliquus]|nr:hypothetical protein OEZ86_000682 [Tetradesmus obliquus]
MDAAVLVELLQVGDESHAQFVQLLDHKLQDHNFKEALRALAPAVCSQGQQASAAVVYVLRCLLYCQQHTGELSAGLKHLLLELILPEAAKAAGKQARSTAVQLFTAYCTPVDAKLAAKVAAIFKLTREDVSDWQLLTAAVQQMLTSQSSYKAAVHLLMQFEGLDEAIDKPEVIAQLVADGQDNLAQQWVAALGRDYQILFVEACVAQDRLKPAARAVRVLGLTAEFPNIESLYRQRSLARLVGKRLWQVALSFVGSDVALQTQLVRDMAEVGEAALAHEYRKQLQLPESVLKVDPAAIAAQEEARRQQYMQLELPQGSLLFVDDEATLLQAAQLLAGSDVVGLDVEWKPSHMAGEASPAALLQLATRKAALLFDLLALAPHHPTALDACLAPIFESPEVLKLGFGLTGDLAKLAGSWPEVQAFKVVAGVLDLRPLWVAYGVANRQKGGSVRLLSDVGLSTLCSTLLGKPLDKSQQMSDWTARPLSQRQMHYAALDSLVLPQLFDTLCLQLGEQRSQQLLKQHTTCVRRQQGPPSAATAAAAATAEETAADGQAAEAAGIAADIVAEEAAVGTAAAAQRSTGLAPAHGGNGRSSTELGPDIVEPAAVGGNGRAAVSSSGSSSDSSSAAGVGGDASGEARVAAFLQHRGFSGALRRLPTTRAQGCVPTISDTAAALSVPRAAVAKTMALLVDHEPLLVVTRGDQRIDLHKLAALLGVSRRAVRMAPDAVVQQVTGFSSGGIPPIGHDSSIKTSVPRFLVDSMLGRLCRWLRALGVDAEFVETGGKQQAQQQARVQGQPQLLQTLGQQQQGQLIEAIHKAALTEGRLFLTRDTKLAARRDVGGSVYLLATDDAAEQLTEISRHFGIGFDESTAMSRCSVCNAAAFQQIARGAAEALVPPCVMEVVEEFWQCGNCGKVFWMGPKSQAAIDLLSSLFTNGRTAKPYQRADYSHSTVKLMKIAHDNQVLVKRLTSISHKDPSWVKDLGKTASCNVASSAVNRRKAASTIAQENHALYQRLVAIRPSKDISRETLAAEARRNEAYRANCATFKPKSSPGGNTAATTAAAAGPEYFGTV